MDVDAVERWRCPCSSDFRNEPIRLLNIKTCLSLALIAGVKVVWEDVQILPPSGRGRACIYSVECTALVLSGRSINHQSVDETCCDAGCWQAWTGCSP